jgi:glycerol-3-phosphate O-acyltransferase/dihydroxyacetone phosphate acyltransferase
MRSLTLHHFVAWALDVVPVKRAQDEAIRGTGLVQFVHPPSTSPPENGRTPTNVQGIGTKFTEQFRVKDKIRPFGTSQAFKIASIESDVLLTIMIDNDHETEPTGESSTLMATDKVDIPLYYTQPVTFDIFKRIDQSVVYEKVLDRLAQGGSVGIFPEGGSHDRTDLLPLKVGVALIAYMALERDGLNVPIVPVGLNYFSAHRWRGRAVVEYGQPILLNPSTLAQFKAGGPAKHKVCNDLLDQIQDSMKSVIVSAPDYETLQLIHTARRLYQRKVYLNVEEKQDLNRRFAEGYKRLLLMTKGNPPPE